MAGGLVLYVLLRRYLARCEDGPPGLRWLTGQRIFERVLQTVCCALGALGCALRHAAAAAAVAVAGRGGVPRCALADPGDRPGAAAAPVPGSPLFALLWAVGVACAVGAAWQAKFHRLAALILLGGAGLVTCITFVWFSAPDLALTQLLVEIVTTVLILLGLRWLPKRLADVDRRRYAAADARRRTPSSPSPAASASPWPTR